MSDRIRLSSIELTTPEGEPVRLTVAQARDLYVQLDELFGEKVHYVPTQPVIIERERWPNPWRRYRPFWYDTITGQSAIQMTADSGLSVRMLSGNS